MIVCVCGLIDSGKDTLANYLVESCDFKRESFAESVKDAVSSIFCWDRSLLEGKTKKSRIWRDQVDEWWSNRLGINNLTPRWVLQHFATDICRDNLHSDIWVASLEKKINSTQANIVISDGRFRNEIKSITDMGGISVRIQRGDEPIWKNDAILAINGDVDAIDRLDKLNIHCSEWEIFVIDFDYIIYNDGPLDKMFNDMDSIISNIKK